MSVWWDEGRERQAFGLFEKRDRSIRGNTKSDEGLC